MRLIDADALKSLWELGAKHLSSLPDGMGELAMACTAHMFAGISRSIDEAPTIDASPVVHGKWVKTHSWYYCSECGSEMFFTGEFDEDQRYCYSCGAKMDGKGKENADL